MRDCPRWLKTTQPRWYARASGTMISYTLERYGLVQPKTFDFTASGQTSMMKDGFGTTIIYRLAMKYRADGDDAKRFNCSQDVFRSQIAVYAATLKHVSGHRALSDRRSTSPKLLSTAHPGETCSTTIQLFSRTHMMIVMSAMTLSYSSAGMRQIIAVCNAYKLLFRKIIQNDEDLRSTLYRRQTSGSIRRKRL